MPATVHQALPRSLADVYQIEVVRAPGAPAEAPPGLLIEVPHGATRARHFAATRRRLRGDFPDDLEEFFHVNTDVGSVECARHVARMVTREDDAAVRAVVILRGLVARTFIDLNRVIAGAPKSDLDQGLTPGLPAYLGRADDVETLREMHAAYQTAAAGVYESVCGAGGRAVILHTYAPRSVRIDRVDGKIVSALRRAYEPAVWRRWELRPEVDLITAAADGRRLAPEALVRRLRERYREIGVEAAESSTYRLHQGTLGYVHSARHPGRVLCMEIRRDLLVERFTPFVEMSVSDRKARRMAAPIAAALLDSSSA